MMSNARQKSPKAYELARELEMSPRALIAIARTLGITVQNRLTRIAPAAAQRLAAHCASRAGGEASKNDTISQCSDDSA